MTEKIQCKHARLSGNVDCGYYTEFCVRVKGHRGDCKYEETF